MLKLVGGLCGVLRLEGPVKLHLRWAHQNLCGSRGQKAPFPKALKFIGGG